MQVKSLAWTPKPLPAMHDYIWVEGLLSPSEKSFVQLFAQHYLSQLKGQAERGMDPVHYTHADGWNLAHTFITLIAELFNPSHLIIVIYL